MDRRDFLKIAGLTGLAVMAPLTLNGSLASAGGTPPELAPYTGPLWVSIHAPGGWDPALLCDPKGSETGITNLYATGDIREAGAIRYAPIGNNDVFFKKYKDRLCVVNGIDTATGTHDAGPAHVWSGTLRGGWPCVAAVMAAALGPGRPLCFMSNGGYDQTAGIVAKTVGNPAAFSADPNILEGSGEGARRFHSEAAMARIRDLQAKRLAALRDAQSLPQRRRATGELYAARLAAPELSKLREYMPAALSEVKMLRQAQLAFAAYRAGLAVSATIVADVNLDTHTNHDAGHVEGMTALLTGVDLILEEAEALGIADRLVVMIGSDFGRAPLYNSEGGKDHYSITSMMFMGPGIQGNRVVGSTDEALRPVLVSPSSLAPAASGGVRITPAHVHRAIRRLGGASGTEVDKAWPVHAPEDMALFG
jgi:hypothetical protein